MNLHRLAQQRAAGGRPVKVGLIGAGKFGSMFLAQVPTMADIEVAVIADLDLKRARAACHTVGWNAAQLAKTAFVDSGAEACAHPEIEVVVEATGVPTAGIVHARAAIAGKKHIVMVNVEADVLAGPLLAAEARAAGVVYSLAYGDQPALVCELVDWARACGFEVAAAFVAQLVERFEDIPLPSKSLLNINVPAAPPVGVEVTSLGNRIYRNTNRLIDAYAGTDGMKTGFTCASGYNLVATASRGRRRPARSRRLLRLRPRRYSPRTWESTTRSPTATWPPGCGASPRSGRNPAATRSRRSSTGCPRRYGGAGSSPASSTSPAWTRTPWPPAPARSRTPSSRPAAKGTRPGRGSSG